MSGLGGVRLDVFHGGFTFLNSCGSRAGINGVGTDLYHQPLGVEFSSAQNLP